MNPLIQSILSFFASLQSILVVLLAFIFIGVSCILLARYLWQSRKRGTFINKDRPRRDIENPKILPTSIESLTLQIGQLNDEITIIKKENGLLRQKVRLDEEYKKNIAHLENELHLSLKEVAHLQNTLAEANVILGQYEKELPLKQNITIEEEETFLKIVNSLQSSIFLIISQVKNILNEHDNIKEPLYYMNPELIDRILTESHHILEQIYRINNIDTLGSLRTAIPQGFIDIERIVEQAISLSTAKMRDKYISLRVDLSEKLPLVRTEKDVIQKVIKTLLENACTITQLEETINLKIRYKNDGQLLSTLLIIATNRSSGLSESELTDLFVKASEIDNNHELLEDSNMDLSEVKNLVEARGGKICFDYEKESHYSFVILFPLEMNPAGILNAT